MCIKILSLFSGIGAYEKALTNLKLEYEVVNYCEINDKISEMYSIIHNVPKTKNLKDVSKIDALPDFDLLTFSPPCQDISSIGKHAGIKETTRTGLMLKVLNFIRDKSPSYFIMENVKTLNTVYRKNLIEYVNYLEKLGYKCYNEVLNAKDYGLPQNRQRLFLVGTKKKFKFPQKVELKNNLSSFIGQTDREVCKTIRVGGRQSKITDKRNWDTYKVNGKNYCLTAKDCLLLMGFSSEDYSKLKNAGISNNMICKGSGNSVAVPVLEAIFKELEW